jgi:hypothetical protein
MRLFGRVVLGLLLLVIAAAALWGPAYARGLSLVVRAAHLEGWLKAAADAEARPWLAGEAFTIATRYDPIPARLYRPKGASTRAVVLTRSHCPISSATGSHQNRSIRSRMPRAG